MTTSQANVEQTTRADLEAEVRRVWSSATVDDVESILAAANNNAEIIAARELRVTAMQLSAAAFARFVDRRGRRLSFSEARDADVANWYESYAGTDEHGRLLPASADAIRAGRAKVLPALLEMLDGFLESHDVQRLQGSNPSNRMPREHERILRVLDQAARNGDGALSIIAIQDAYSQLYNSDDDEEPSRPSVGASLQYLRANGFCKFANKRGGSEVTSAGQRQLATLIAGETDQASAQKRAG